MYFNETINKNNNDIKIIELYNKRILNIVLEFIKETKYFTLTISTIQIIVVTIKSFLSEMIKEKLNSFFDIFFYFRNISINPEL